MEQKLSASWRAKVALALPLIYMAVIFRFSAMTGSSLHISVSDKLLHTVEYTGLSFLLYIAFRYGLGWTINRSTWWAVGTTVLYGLSDEWHQSFVPGRDSSILDIAADATGALLAQAGLFLIRTIRRHNGLSS